MAVFTPTTSPMHLEGRTTRIALLTGASIWMKLVVRPVADIAATCRDDTCGDGPAETERIANREHPVTDPRLFRSKLGKRKTRTASTLISATSVRASVPTTLAV